jgi:hypothetical protein
VNLQFGFSAAFGEREGGRSPMFIGLEPPESIVDLAATVCALDLVISVDTMVAHLAGALGRPVDTLLRFEADWRWMTDRSDSPWYPSMKLFRQPMPGAWAAVASEVESDLRARFPVRSLRRPLRQRADRPRSRVSTA